MKRIVRIGSWRIDFRWELNPHAFLRIFGRHDACSLANNQIAQVMLSNVSERNASPTRARFIVIDRDGPLADFETWEDAFQYVRGNGVQGGTIVRGEESLVHSPCRTDCLNDDRIHETACATGQFGRLALGHSDGLPGRKLAPKPAATKAKKSVIVTEEDICMMPAMAQIVRAAGA